MKYNQKLAARFPFFAMLVDEADTYKLRNNAALNAEESGLIEDITRYLSDESDIIKVKGYVERMLKLGGFSYLTSVHDHIVNTVLPSLQFYRKTSQSLERQQPGQWHEHVAIMNQDHNNLVINSGILRRALQEYSQAKECDAVPCMKR